MRTFRNATRELDNDTFGGDFWVHKPYTPNLRSQAPRISNEEWRKHEALIRELHEDGCTSERAREILREESQDANGCFNPSAAQYAAQLRALGLRTYNTKRYYCRPQEASFSNDLLQENRSDVTDRQQPHDGHKVPIEKTLRSIPEGRDISDASTISPMDSAITPGSTPQTMIDSTDELTAEQVSVRPAYAAVGMVKDIPLTGVRPRSPARAISDWIDDTYVLEEAGPLLTFLKIVEPGFAYEPNSTILKMWPQFDSNPSRVTWSILNEVGKVADCLHAARSYADAFDLYYMIFCHLHKTLDTYIRQHLIMAVLNCARSSSTDQQDECAIAVLRLTLRDQERGTGDRISLGVLHLYLGELYKKQRSEKSEVCAMTAIQYLTEVCGAIDHEDPYFSHFRTRTVLELDLPRPLHTSIILQGETIPPEYAPYFTPDLGSPASRLVRDIVSHTVSKKLLKWCADVIASKAQYLNHLASTLVGDAPAMRECMDRLLFCCCIEMWLNDSKGTSGTGGYFSKVKAALEESEMPWHESLSAISFVIVEEAFRDSDPIPAIKKRFKTKTFASHLVRTIKALLGRINETDQSFTNTFLAFVVTSGDGREPSQMDKLSRKVLEVFCGNLVRSGILREQYGSLVTDAGLVVELTPAAAELQEYTVRQPSFPHMLYTPRSSFSSGARSLRVLHAELDQISVTSLSTSKSKRSLVAAWPQSRRSSWSFDMVKGIGRGSSLYVPEVDLDDGLVNPPAHLEDTVMADV